ncbi:MAG: phage portal protein [Vallitaleaceae bacterium]|nr:phage portal protein [Vallitaleaceae bacterium]
MKLFGQELTKEVNNYTLTSTDTTFLSALGIDVNSISQDKLGEVTFFVCLKHLSESLGKLPLEQHVFDEIKGMEKVRNSKLNTILNLEPNEYMNATSFWQTVEFNRNYHGNSYVYIERKGLEVVGLWIIPYAETIVYVDDAGLFKEKNSIWYVWTDSKTGKKYTFKHTEILHLKSSVSFDGIMGVAVKDVLKLQVETGQYAQSYLQKLYKGNMFGGKVILQYTGDLGIAGKDTLIKETERYANSVGTGKFLPIPLGISATTLDMKLSDAEFTELNKLNALQIASAFGIKPNILNNYDKSSYSNSETQQLDFYINSLSPILKQYKEELTRKLLSYKDKQNNVLEHDIKALFKLDPSKQMDMLAKGMNNLMYTVNEAREELGKPYINDPRANEPIGNGNYIMLSQVGDAYLIKSSKGGENENE